jgi:hypothetical protein
MTAAAINPAGDGSRRHRAAMWLGHYFPTVALYLTAVLLAARLVEFWTAGHSPAYRVADVVAFIVSAILIVMFLCHEGMHARHLCERDLAVSRVLLDPQGEVEKRRRLLKANHRRSAFWLFLAAGLVLIGIGIIDGLPRPSAVTIVFTVLEVVCAAFAVFFVTAMLVHRRLQPWCPDCDHGGGDGDDKVPAPGPVPSGTVSG